MEKSNAKANSPVSVPNPNAQLELMLRHYLPNTGRIDGLYPELEARFSTKGAKLTKIQYDNVLQLLLAKGFKLYETIDRLSIGTQFLSDDGVRESSIRVEVHDIVSIQEYCRTNTLNPKEVRNGIIKFVEKQAVTVEGGEKIDNANFTDFNFLVSYKNEKNHNKQSQLVEKMVADWVNLKKTFRLISRLRFKSATESRVMIDMTVVRSSPFTFVNRKQENTFYHNIADSNVFTNQPSYEIEAELNNIRFSSNDRVAEVVGLIHKTAKTILCGIQNTNYPISISEKNAVLANYSELVYNKIFPKLYPSNFIGPSSVTLQRHNITPTDPQNKEPNVLNAYAVTDKADGERHLLFITNNGGIYLISTGMDVLSTGTHTKDPGHFNTLIDGELIKRNKHGKFINKFAAFDLYYFKGKDYRKEPLMLSAKKAVTRLALLDALVQSLDQIPNKGVKSAYVYISIKTFLHSGNIFEDCRKILNEQTEDNYNIDGLIFTHTTFGVGSDEQGKAGPPRLTTWKHSFKWKPAEYNTVDFLISTQKDKTNNDIVSSVFVEQVAMSYKTLILKCGYSEKDHGFMSPVMDVLDKIKEKEKEREESDDGGEMKDDRLYRAEQFVPYDPIIPSAGLCHVPLRSDGSTQQMMTIENEPIEDDTIVEFKFDKNRYDAGEDIQSCWIPIRNRYDKTAKYKSGEKMFGNSYHTANSNWHSIHFAVTTAMICGDEPPVIDTNSDVYYNNTTKKSNTEGLRNFHNVFVKKTLIRSVSKVNDTLIDYGCGKGGDLSKWIERKLSFVFGVDYSKDNIENRFDGAYARFLSSFKRYSVLPKALFVNGDCSRNIRSGEAIEGDINKEIVRAVFGQDNKTQFETHDGIYESYGLGTSGFNVSSCQFAIHYFFKNTDTFHNFLRNVSECTAMHGYFIGTCYDGHAVMDKLDRYTYDTGVKMYEGNKLICEIIKQYDSEEFEADETCLGKQILVYQDSINQYIPEYLVNFRFLVRMMELYGFALLNNHELKQLNLQIASTGMFVDLFRQMERNPLPENADGLRMTESEKMVSFLNRYFIFKKINNVNAETVANSFIQPEKEDASLSPPVEQAPEPTEIVLPLHRAIELKSSTHIEEEEETKEPKQKATTKKITEKVKNPRTKKVAAFNSPEEGEEVVVKKRAPKKAVVEEKKEEVKEEVKEEIKDVEVVVKKRAPKKATVVEEKKEGEEVKPKRKYTKKNT